MSTVMMRESSNLSWFLSFEFVCCLYISPNLICIGEISGGHSALVGHVSNCLVSYELTIVIAQKKNSYCRHKISDLY